MAHSAYLGQIVSNPDDDALRLRYADWLEEQGDPLAELVRVQYQLEQATECDRPWGDLLQRESALLRRHQARWEQPLRGGLRSHPGGAREILGRLFGRRAWQFWFRKGFIEEVTTSADAFLANVETLFRHAPVRHLVLHQARDSFALLAVVPQLLRLDSLQLYSGATKDTALASLIAAARRLNFRLLLLRGAVHDSYVDWHLKHGVLAQVRRFTYPPTNLLGDRPAVYGLYYHPEFWSLVRAARAWGVGLFNLKPYPGGLICFFNPERIEHAGFKALCESPFFHKALL
jgi:uncharacterized protein (TIGR02996 family)